MNTAAQHRELARWWGVSIDTDDGMGALKRAFDARGLGRRAWRLYLDYGDALFEPLKPEWLSDDKPFSSPERAARYLAFLQSLESDIPPPPALVRTLSNWRIPEQRLESVPTRFFRAAWKRYSFAELKGDGAETLASEITPVARWFLNEAQALHGNDNLLKAGWSSILRACVEAHEEAEEEVSLDTTWFAVMRSVELGPFRFEAILNQRDLVEEGSAMNHCIASYGQWFATELARPFSIRCRKTGARLATMVIHEDAPGRWQIDQLSGHSNEAVSDTIQEAAYAVVRALEDALALDPCLDLLIEDARAKQPRDSQWSCWTEDGV